MSWHLRVVGNSEISLSPAITFSLFSPVYLIYLIFTTCDPEPEQILPKPVINAIVNPKPCPK
jgi:hypothetical protein